MLKQRPNLTCEQYHTLRTALAVCRRSLCDNIETFKRCMADDPTTQELLIGIAERQIADIDAMVAEFNRCLYVEAKPCG